MSLSSCGSPMSPTPAVSCSLKKAPVEFPAYDECKALSAGYGPKDGCFVYNGKRYRYKEHSTLAFNDARDAGVVELFDKCETLCEGLSSIPTSTDLIGG